MRSSGLRVASLEETFGKASDSRPSRRALASVTVPMMVLALGSSLASSASAQTARDPAPAAQATPAPTAVVPDKKKEAATEADLAGTVPGGLTSDQVAQRAAATSYTAKASQKAIESAEERTNQAAMRWAPIVSLKASYTRLSHISYNIQGFAYNPPFDNWMFEAQLAVPISDYFLRIGKGYTAATRSEEAARYDLAASRAKSFSDGKLAYYMWLRARGGIVVAQQTLEVARAHLKDAQNLFSVGNASKADVLRAETQVASAELAVERAKSATTQAETQVRIAMHSGAEESIQPGEALEGTLAPTSTSIQQLVAEGLAQRPEIKSIDKNAEAAQKQASVLDAGKYPVLSGFAEAQYSNPNQRLFPPRNEFFPTWYAGAQLTWTTADFLNAGPAAKDAEARAQQLEAQKGQVRDGIELEIVQAYQSLLEADTAIETTTRQLASALEGSRVAGELFNNGRGTGTTVIDAENALAAARFDNLNARVDARIARVRLEHAVGRDVRATNAQ